MSIGEFNRIAYPVALVATVFLALALPLARRRSMARKTNHTDRTETPHSRERIIRGLLLSCGLLFAVWTMFYAALGPERLAVWPIDALAASAGWCVAVVGLVIVRRILGLGCARWAVPTEAWSRRSQRTEPNGLDNGAGPIG